MIPEPAHELTLTEHAAASEKRHDEILEDIAECREKIDALQTTLETQEPPPQSTAPELVACLTRLETLESQQAETLRELRETREALQASIRENHSELNRSTLLNSSEEPETPETVNPPETPDGPNSPQPEGAGAAVVEPERRSTRPKRV